jgi:hypothetical protein
MEIPILLNYNVGHALSRGIGSRNVSLPGLGLALTFIIGNCIYSPKIFKKTEG